MSVLLPGQVFPRTCYCCSWCMYLCVSVYGVWRPCTCRCVCRVSSQHPVCASAASVTSKVCGLRDHNANVLVYDISAGTSCRNFHALVALSHWVLCGPSLLDWSNAEYAFLFWMQGGVPGQFRMSPGMRWYTKVGLNTVQGISDKLRELTHYAHSASAVNQALHIFQHDLQGTHPIMYLYR